MPFQLVNDSPTEAIVGTHTRPMWMIAGMPTARASTIRSWRVRRLNRRRGLGAAAAAGEVAMSGWCA